jgi:hypothetical protein
MQVSSVRFHSEAQSFIRSGRTLDLDEFMYKDFLQYFYRHFDKSPRRVASAHRFHKSRRTYLKARAPRQVLE